MDTTLPKEHVFQESDSNTCGPSSLAMVYRLKGKDISVKSILEDLHQEGKGEATYAPQLARHLNAKQLKTRLLISSSKIVSPAWHEVPKDELIENLKAWLARHPKNDWHLNNLHLLFYLQEGGELEIASYTTATLKAALDRQSLLIICVDEDWLWGHRLKRKDGVVKVNEIAGKLEGHFVVVTSYEQDEFHVLDPFPTNLVGRHGSYTVDAAQLLNASLTWDPQVIEIFV